MAILGFIGAFLLGVLLLVNAVGASPIGWIFGFGTMAFVVYMVEENNKREETEKQQRQKAFNEKTKLESRPYQLREKIISLYCNDRVHYSSKQVEANYNDLTELEKKWGIVLPESPNYNDENLKEYLSRVEQKKYFEDKENFKRRGY